VNDSTLFWDGITLSIDQLGGLENKRQHAFISAHRQARCFDECVSENGYKGHRASNQTNPPPQTRGLRSKSRFCGLQNYVEAIAANLPIGSGITEAACKVIIKARLCCSGMKWKDRCDRISIK